MDRARRRCGEGHRTGDPRREPDERPGGILAPGLCDLQVNGASGREVCGGGDSLDRIEHVQLVHGVTSYLPTPSSPDDATAERGLSESRSAHLIQPRE